MAKAARFPRIRAIIYYVFLVVALTVLFRCLVMLTGNFQVEADGPVFRLDGAVFVDWSSFQLDLERNGRGWSTRFEGARLAEPAGALPDVEDLTLFHASRTIGTSSWTGHLICPNWAVIAVAVIPWYLVRVSVYLYLRKKRAARDGS